MQTAFHSKSAIECLSILASNLNCIHQPPTFLCSENKGNFIKYGIAFVKKSIHLGSFNAESCWILNENPNGIFAVRLLLC